MRRLVLHAAGHAHVVRDGLAVTRLDGDAPPGRGSAGRLRHVNAAALSALGATGVGAAKFTAGPVARTGSKASATVTEQFALPAVGTWAPTTQIHLVQRKGIAFAIVVQNSGGVNGGPLDGPLIAHFFSAHPFG